LIHGDEVKNLLSANRHFFHGRAMDEATGQIFFFFGQLGDAGLATAGSMTPVSRTSKSPAILPDIHQFF
jgi:hypothetical protein